jgi:hypothetical protein
MTSTARLPAWFSFDVLRFLEGAYRVASVAART